jgi:hypothetical protein
MNVTMPEFTSPTSKFNKNLKEWLTVYKDNLEPDESMIVWAHFPGRPRIHVVSMKFDDPLFVLDGGDPETRTPCVVFSHAHSLQLVADIVKNATPEEKKRAFIGFKD